MTVNYDNRVTVVTYENNASAMMKKINIRSTKICSWRLHGLTDKDNINEVIKNVYFKSYIMQL